MSFRTDVLHAEYIAKRIPLIALKWVPSIALERVPASEPVIFSY